MKRNKTSHQQCFSSSSSSSSSIQCLYLPNECWERVFKFLLIKNNPHGYLNSLSLVSKQFLCVTDRFRFSLSIQKLGRPFVPHLLHRFSNLKSLNFSSYQGRLNLFLRQISRFSLNHLTSLNLSNQPAIPAIGLRACSQNITTLTSLTCSYVGSFSSTDMLLIADCFPLLEELDLNNPGYCYDSYGSYLDGLETLSLALSKLRKIDLSGHIYVNDRSLVHIFKHCKLLETLILFNCYRDIGMEMMRLEKSDSLIDFMISPQLGYLCLSCSTWINDDSIVRFASIFPNLQKLDLRCCINISEGICQVLKKCSRIRHLNLKYCSNVKLLGMNFEVPTLEVLNLSNTKVDDQILYLISKNCHGLLQLSLKGCYNVTNKGVMDVVKKCMQLRAIDLKGCIKVHDDDVGIFKAIIDKNNRSIH